MRVQKYAPGARFVGVGECRERKQQRRQNELHSETSLGAPLTFSAWAVTSSNALNGKRMGEVDGWEIQRRMHDYGQVLGMTGLVIGVE